MACGLPNVVSTGRPPGTFHAPKAFVLEGHCGAPLRRGNAARRAGKVQRRFHETRACQGIAARRTACQALAVPAAAGSQEEYVQALCAPSSDVLGDETHSGFEQATALSCSVNKSYNNPASTHCCLYSGRVEAIAEQSCKLLIWARDCETDALTMNRACRGSKHFVHSSVVSQPCCPGWFGRAAACPSFRSPSRCVG